MADGLPDREALLRAEYHGQTARIAWRELQTHFARGVVVAVSKRCDLVEIAVQLGLDNTDAFTSWIDSGDVAAVGEEQAQVWYDLNTELWAVVAAPWVLVQEQEPDEN